MATKQRKGVADTTDSRAQRLNLRVSPEAAKRLGVHAVMTGTPPGRLVEHLIETYLKDFRVQVIKGASGSHSDRLDLAASVSQAESAAA